MSKEYQQKLIKLIHVGKRELGMTDDDYRAMLANLPALEGVTSVAGLPVPKLQAVLEAMKVMGFRIRPNNKNKGKPHNFDQQPAEITKIGALLADMGLPWSYGDAIAEQMFKVKRLAWIKDRKQLKAIIAALYKEQKKQGLHDSIMQYKQQMKAEQWTELEDKLPKGWDRSIRTMEQILEYLSTRGIEA